MELRERLRDVIRNSGLSLPAFANKVGVSRTTLVSYRDGDTSPSIDFLEKVCREFSVNPSWLLLGVGTPYVADSEGVVEQVLKVHRSRLDEVDIDQGVLMPDLLTEEEAHFELLALATDAANMIISSGIAKFSTETASDLILVLMEAIDSKFLNSFSHTDKLLILFALRMAFLRYQKRSEKKDSEP